MSTLALQVVFNVLYDTHGVPPEQLQELVTRNLDNMVGDGGLSGSTEAEVDVWEPHFDMELPAEDELSQITQLRMLYRLAQKLRDELKLSAPEEVIYQGDTPEGIVTVIADGLGGAAVFEVEGNFPIDFSTHRERQGLTEQEACNLAQRWLDGEDDEDDGEDDES